MKINGSNVEFHFFILVFEWYVTDLWCDGNINPIRTIINIIIKWENSDKNRAKLLIEISNLILLESLLFWLFFIFYIFI